MRGAAAKHARLFYLVTTESALLAAIEAVLV
jgi:hypothetical protein